MVLKLGRSDDVRLTGWVGNTIYVANSRSNIANANDGVSDSGARSRNSTLAMVNAIEQNPHVWIFPNSW